MKTYIFDKIEDLNEFLDGKNSKKVEVQWQSRVVSSRKEKDEMIYDIVDRWLVVLK